MICDLVITSTFGTSRTSKIKLDIFWWKFGDVFVLCALAQTHGNHAHRFLEVFSVKEEVVNNIKCQMSISNVDIKYQISKLVTMLPYLYHVLLGWDTQTDGQTNRHHNNRSHIIFYPYLRLFSIFWNAYAYIFSFLSFSKLHRCGIQRII